MTDLDDAVPPEQAGADNKTPVTRVLTAGAKGAERVARATGVDRALNQAAEEAIVRALRSPGVMRALARAIESHDVGGGWDSDEIVRLVKTLLASDAAAQAWAQFLESEQAQMLVERIAGAPEIRAAITSHGTARRRRPSLRGGCAASHSALNSQRGRVGLVSGLQGSA